MLGYVKERQFWNISKTTSHKYTWVWTKNSVYPPFRTTTYSTQSIFTVHNLWWLVEWIGDCVLIKTTHLTLEKLFPQCWHFLFVTKDHKNWSFFWKHHMYYCAACVCPAQPIKLKWLAFFTNSVVSLSLAAAYEQTNQHSGFFCDYHFDVVMRRKNLQYYEFSTVRWCNNNSNREQIISPMHHHYSMLWAGAVGWKE